MPTSASAACPSCRSDEHVTGRRDPEADDVQLSCGRCGRSWGRGGRRCATCAGVALTSRPQVMRRHSRGTQLSIVGWRDALLCERCDADVLATLGHGHTPIPEDYVSAALVDRNAPAPAAPRAHGPVPPPSTAGRPVRAPRPVPPSAGGWSSGEPSVPPSIPAPAPPAPPTTVRQALQESQTNLAAAGTTLDPTVVLLLGTHLGPATRLNALERSGHDADTLRDWVERTWGGGGRGAAARHTLTTLADHWSDQGWTTTDLAAGLRPQEDA